MSSVVWEPETHKPAAAAALEEEIRRLAPGVQVKLTLDGDAWLVRALAPAAMCGRGPDLAGRDLSEVIAQLLGEHDLPARVRRR